MGCYVNPPEEIKEAWLERVAKKITVIEARKLIMRHMMGIDREERVVCLVQNFTESITETTSDLLGEGTAVIHLDANPGEGKIPTFSAALVMFGSRDANEVFEQPDDLRPTLFFVVGMNDLVPVAAELRLYFAAETREYEQHPQFKVEGIA